MSGALVSTVVVCFAGLSVLAATCRWAYARLRQEFGEDGDADGDDEGGAKDRLGRPADGGLDGGGLIETPAHV